MYVNTMWEGMCVNNCVEFPCIRRSLDAQLRNLECNAVSATAITHHFLGKMVSQNPKPYATSAMQNIAPATVNLTNYATA